MQHRFLITAVATFAAMLGLAAAADNPTEASPDEEALRGAGLSTDGPALLEFFRGRSQVAVDPEEVRKLIGQLSAAPEIRARAAAGLVARGPVVVPALRHAVNDLADATVTEHARRCLQWIEGSAAAGLPAAAARLLAERKPPGAAEVLLSFLPFSDNAEVAEHTARALGVLAFLGDRPEPAL
jgi:hypothetical protein